MDVRNLQAQLAQKDKRIRELEEALLSAEQQLQVRGRGRAGSRTRLRLIAFGVRARARRRPRWRTRKAPPAVR